MIMYIYIKYKPLIKEKKRDTYADRQIIGNLDTYVSDFFFFKPSGVPRSHSSLTNYAYDILSKQTRKRERARERWQKQ